MSIALPWFRNPSMFSSSTSLTDLAASPYYSLSTLVLY